MATTLDSKRKASNIVLSNGNLTATVSVSAFGGALATTGLNTGKGYFEVKILNNDGFVGIAGNDMGDPYGYSGGSFDSYEISYKGSGYIYPAGPGSFASFAANDIIGVAVDADAKTIKWYKNNSLQTTQNIPSTIHKPYVPMISEYSADSSWRCYFTGTTYTPPTGYATWDAANPVELTATSHHQCMTGGM